MRTPIRRRVDFKAHCRKYIVPTGYGVSRVPVQCDFHTVEPTLFVEHMATTHKTKIHATAPMWVTTAGKPWRLKLPKDPKPFEPKPLEPGATVTWKQLVAGEWVERTGQVWSLGYAPKSIWVVPFERLDGERAVLVQPGYRGAGLYEHSTWGDDNAAIFKANTPRYPYA